MYVCFMGGINKRDHLIQTGQEQIWSKGYDLCSIKDITTAAGLPKGSFYHYFESKEKFALEAMNQYIDTQQEQLASTSHTLSTLEALLDARIASIINIHFARECYMSVMCHAFSDQDENFRTSIITAINRSNDTMKSLLASLKQAKLIREELDLDELLEFIDFGWRGARLKARMLQSGTPLLIFKKYLFQFILKS